MARVRFVEAAIVYDHRGEIEQEFEAGQEVDLPAPSAHRWVRRGVAVAVPEDLSGPLAAAGPGPGEPEAPEPTAAEVAEATDEDRHAAASARRRGRRA